MSNDSTLPSTFSFKTNYRLSTVNVRAEKISKTIPTLEENKAHRHDYIFVKIIKIC